MSTLSISFVHDPIITGGVKIPLEIVDHNLEQLQEVPSTLTLGQQTQVNVEPGTYLVRAHLPTGEIVATSTMVKAEENQNVLLKLKNVSPQETLGWADREERETLETLIPARLPPFFRNPWEAKLRDLRDLRELSKILGSFFPRAYIEYPVPDMSFWLHKTQSPTKNSRWENLIDNFDYSLPFRKINLSVSLQEQNPRIPVVELKIKMNDFDLREFPGQLWLQIKSSSVQSKFIALPPSKNLRVHLILNDAKQVLVASANSQAEALLGYLSQGDFTSARNSSDTVVQDAERLLWAKLNDPSSAAIAGYYLLSASRLDKLHNWTKNLANWMTWMPDGSVIHAWHLLRQSNSDVEGARNRLVEAAERGVPLYTQGLRLLFDGLSLLEQRANDMEQEDEKVKSALDYIRPYAASANWQSPITTFFGKNPQEPMPPYSLL